MSGRRTASPVDRLREEQRYVRATAAVLFHRQPWLEDYVVDPRATRLPLHGAATATELANASRLRRAFRRWRLRRRGWMQLWTEMHVRAPWPLASPGVRFQARFASVTPPTDGMHIVIDGSSKGVQVHIDRWSCVTADVPHAFDQIDAFVADQLVLLCFASLGEIGMGSGDYPRPHCMLVNPADLEAAEKAMKPYEPICEAFTRSWSGKLDLRLIEPRYEEAYEQRRWPPR